MFPWLLQQVGEWKGCGGEGEGGGDTKAIPAAGVGNGATNAHFTRESRWVGRGGKQVGG